MTKPNEKTDAEVKEEVKPTEAENPGEKPTEAENQGFEFVDDDEEEEVETEIETKPEEKETKPPESGETPKEEINQESVNKKINTLTFKRREAEEQRDEVKSKLAEAQEEIKRLKGESDKVVIPPLPDPYDENYAQLMKEREEAIAKQATIDAQASIEQQRQQDLLTQQRNEANRKIRENSVKMYKGAETLGFKKDDFEKAEILVGSYIKHMPDVASFILEREDSPLIIQYLSSNADALEKLSHMSPVGAGVFIATDIATKAQGLKPKASETPEPLDLVKGKGGGEDKESPYLEGVTME